MIKKYQYINALNMDEYIVGTVEECEKWREEKGITSTLVCEISENTGNPKTVGEMLVDGDIIPTEEK